MSRGNRPPLLIGAAASAASLAGGAAIAVIAGWPAGTACLGALFLFSCVLVGVAQQALP